MIFFFCGPLQRVVVVPDHLDDEVVGLRARRGEMRLRHARRERDQPLGELRRRRVRFVAERMVVGQLRHLLGGGLHEPLLAEADRDAPQARETFDIFLALIVVDAHAFAALDHHRPDLLMAARVGGGVEIIGDVAGGERIRPNVHAGLRDAGGICAFRRGLSRGRGFVCGATRRNSSKAARARRRPARRMGQALHEVGADALGRLGA